MIYERQEATSPAGIKKGPALLRSPERVFILLRGWQQDPHGSHKDHLLSIRLHRSKISTPSSLMRISLISPRCGD